MSFYSLPLDFSKLKTQKLSKCSLTESIGHNLDLIMHTYCGECHHDRDFGCHLWSEDFRLQDELRDENHKIVAGETVVLISQALENAILKNELRVSNPTVDVRFSNQINIDQSSTKVNFKVKVTCNIALTDEPYEREWLLYFSPMVIE